MLARPVGVEILETLDRCSALERAAGAIYTLLAERFRDDAALCALWSGMAADEREHTHKLATWRTLIAAEAAEHRPIATGFDEAVRALETILRRAHVQAMGALTQDEAFTIALDLETSELDSLYATLLHSSPIARYPDMEENIRHEASDHHGALVRMVRERSRDEHNLLRTALLTGHDADVVGPHGIPHR